MIKTVIFDWGGVIAPIHGGGWLGALADMLERPIEDLVPHWHAAGYEDFSKGAISEDQFFGQLEISLDNPLPQNVSRIWIDGSAFTPWPEMLRYIQKLKDSNLRVALLSNTVKPMSVLAREKGLYDYFDSVILSDVVGLAKPETSIYLMTLDKLQVNAKECIYIDDLPKNIVPAKKMGMVTILASKSPSQTIFHIEQAINL